ncbi:hypothetical protein F5J12DRAFT_907962 [Pisolithus orientalis]|uniref:uncharacterized protein n=1 Tax=Pisolithus orientalis TaxID=936130 RepID=UPI002224BCDD|nr:uncharacterized protein F5J12DRAFT_907962 [Pisolithus orientalis]KAI5984115.1 hypothetical protein F5J12DRAFT_907962 [Pisolithus orientalis]
MHHPSLGCVPPSFAISTGSPDHLGQDYNGTDHNADMFPPATEYDIPTPSHQELSDVDGNGNDSDSLGWEHKSLGPVFIGLLADFLFRQAEMPTKKINTLLEIWAMSLLALCGELLFTNQKDLYHIIDSTSVSEVKWENFVVCNTVPWMLNSYNEDFMSGAWAWNKADRIISEDPMTAGATLIPINLGSDKTMVLVATGQTNYYPLYLSIGNVCNTIHHAHCSAVVLIGFLAMPKKIILCGNKYYWHIIYALAAYIADYKGQVLLSCIIWNWCLKCLAHQESLDDDVLHCHCEHGNAMIEEFDFCELWDIQPFTNDFLCADIYGMLSPDILHQLNKGGFKDHLVDWVKHYLIHILGKTQAEKVLDKIDQHDDSKGLMKVYIAAIEGYVPQSVVFTFQAFLEFCYLIHQNIITQQMLVEIDKALRCFHLYCEVFQNAGVVDTFSLPQQHAMKHYYHLICQFSAPNGLCSSITESKHIKAIKQPYQCTNCFQALRQMLLLKQRLNKLITMHTDFKEHGMLNELFLSHVLGALEQAGSYEEELGDAIDAPRLVEAHVSLAHTHHRSQPSTLTVGTLAAELCLPQPPNILCCFYSQLFPTDDLDDIPLNECPPYDGSMHVYNSVCSTFFAPSNLCGLYGMCHEYIHSCPMWRNEGPCFNCIFVVTDPEAEGMHGLDIACYLGTFYLCTVVHWSNCMGDDPDIATGMWIVHPSYNAHNVPHITIIHIDTIYCAAHLIPIYAAHNINTRDIKPHDFYDMFNSFYVNKFADHHAFEIAF